MLHLSTCAILAAALAASVPARAQTAPLAIPKALQMEHKELFEALDAATRARGKTGEAARRAMAVLKPHFEKEERFALPQLGALAELTKKDATPSPELRDDLVRRSEAFRAELPKMLDEHRTILTALRDLQAAAEQEDQDEAADLAERIEAHAAMEEEVLYPAALLVGDYAKRMAGGK